MDRIKRTVCLTFVLVLLLSTTVCASSEVARSSDYLSSYTAYMNADGSGDVSVWFEVFGTGTMDEIGALTIIIEEKAPNSSTWTSVETYRHTNYSNMLKYGKSYNIDHVDYEGTAGYSYRAYVTIWAGKNDDGDSRYYLTSEIVAK